MSAACGAAKPLARGTGSAAAGRWPLFPRRSPGSKERSAVPSVGAGVRGTKISWGSPRPAQRPALVESWIERASRPLPAVLHGRAAPRSADACPAPSSLQSHLQARRERQTPSERAQPGLKPGKAALTPRSSGWRFGGGEERGARVLPSSGALFQQPWSWGSCLCSARIKVLPAGVRPNMHLSFLYLWLCFLSGCEEHVGLLSLT